MGIPTQARRDGRSREKLVIKGRGRARDGRRESWKERVSGEEREKKREMERYGGRGGGENYIIFREDIK